MLTFCTKSPYVRKYKRRKFGSIRQDGTISAKKPTLTGSTISSTSRLVLDNPEGADPAVETINYPTWGRWLNSL